MICSHGDIKIGIRALSSTGDVRHGRHERETAAVHTLLEEMLLEAVTVGHRENGAPFLPQHPGINISISHSLSQVAVALSPRPVGVDTETLRPQLERVKRKFLSDEEATRFTNCHDLLLAWCIKEAAYKVAGIERLDFAHDIVIECVDKVRVKGYADLLDIHVVENTPDHVTVICS